MCVCTFIFSFCFNNIWYIPLISRGYNCHQAPKRLTTIDAIQASSKTTGTQCAFCSASGPCMCYTLRWRQNGRDSVSNHQPQDCLFNRLFRRRSKKTSKLRVTGLCVGNSPGPVNSPHKGPVTRKMFPFDDVIMKETHLSHRFRGNVVPVF